MPIRDIITLAIIAIVLASISTYALADLERRYALEDRI